MNLLKIFGLGKFEEVKPAMRELFALPKEVRKTVNV